MAEAPFGSVLLCVEIRIKMPSRMYLNSVFLITPVYKPDNSIDQMKHLLFKSLTCELSQPCKLNQHSVLRSPKEGFSRLFLRSSLESFPL